VATVFHFEESDDGHAARVREFQRDLIADVGNCIRRHITTGDPAGLSQATYYEIRRFVAEWLELHPSAIVVVGSCRTGFTVKPDKRYLPFTSASDIDVAVVSDRLFDHMWDDIFVATQPNRDWVLSDKQGKLLGRDLFNGWITPEALPPLPKVEHGRRWAEWFANLTRSRICDRHKIRGRLYRNWSRLEQYQSHHVRLCHLAITGGQS
jgi:hypothetical protein